MEFQLSFERLRCRVVLQAHNAVDQTGDGCYSSSTYLFCLSFISFEVAKSSDFPLKVTFVLIRLVVGSAAQFSDVCE